MKKHILILICITVLMVSLAGCGSGAKLDEAGNAAITSDWNLVQFTVNDSKTVVKETPLLIKLFTFRMNPRFSCKDGTNFKLTIGKKTHKGTLTEDGGEYTLTFDDSSKQFTAVINGNTLTITNAEGTIEFIFKTGDQE